MVKIETLYDLFPEQGEDAIKKLYSDPDFQKQLPALVLSRIRKNKQILPIEKEMIPWILSRANFAEVEESYKVAKLFTKYFSYSERLLPLLIDHLEELEELKLKNISSENAYKTRKENFASRCLFSLSFFYPALERLYNRTGAPHPRFYREMGKRTFSSIGEESIADNFEKWEDFMREEAFS